MGSGTKRRFDDDAAAAAAAVLAARVKTRAKGALKDTRYAPSPYYIFYLDHGVFR